MQTLIPLNRMIPGHLGRIAHGIRVRIKTSSLVKAEAREDSARISRVHEAHIAHTARVQIRTSREGKVEAPVDSTGIFRAEGRVDSTRITRVEVWDHAAKPSDVKTRQYSVDLVPAEAVEVSKMQVPECWAEAAEVLLAEILLHRAGATITGRDNPDPEFEVDKALVCGSDNPYRKIRIKPIRA